MFAATHVREDLCACVDPKCQCEELKQGGAGCGLEGRAKRGAEGFILSRPVHYTPEGRQNS